MRVYGRIGPVQQLNHGRIGPVTYTKNKVCVCFFSLNNVSIFCIIHRYHFPRSVEHFLSINQHRICASKNKKKRRLGKNKKNNSKQKKTFWSLLQSTRKGIDKKSTEVLKKELRKNPERKIHYRFIPDWFRSNGLFIFAHSARTIRPTQKWNLFAILLIVLHIPVMRDKNWYECMIIMKSGVRAPSLSPGRSRSRIESELQFLIQILMANVPSDHCIAL